MDGFRVDHDALSAHGRSLAGLTARLQTAAAAGTPLGLAAYGVIGQVFAVAAVDAAVTASGSVARLAEGSRALDDGMHATLRDYLDAERRAGAPFRGEGGR